MFQYDNTYLSTIPLPQSRKKKSKVLSSNRSSNKLGSSIILILNSLQYPPPTKPHKTTKTHHSLPHACRRVAE